MKKITSFLLLFSFFFLYPCLSNAQYDYLIITPDIFLKDATWDEELIVLQNLRGFHPVIESINELTTADEIKNLILTYYNNHPLRYILLMGNGISFIETEDSVEVITFATDYLNKNYIPFYFLKSNNPWHEVGYCYAASDDPYTADLSGHGSVYVGRVPVESVEEANIYVDKLYSYYQSLSTHTEQGTREILLNLDITRTCCTGELVRYISNKLKTEYIPDNISVTELNASEHNYCAPEWLSWHYCPERKEIFEDELNKGVSLITILGTSGGPHSFGGWYWSTNNRGDLPFPELELKLTNKYTRMPFLIATNNQQGDVGNKKYECTMRKLLLHNNGGIIGAIAPTHETEQHVNGFVLYTFHDLLYKDDKLNYGEIFDVLKKELSIEHGWAEFYHNGLTYFGDPSLNPSLYSNTKSNYTLDDYILLGNYPNPFNPSTTIGYILRYKSSVELIIYDIIGAEIKSFVIPAQESGYQKIFWDGRNQNGNLVSSGIYLYKINIKSLENNQTFIKTSKMVLLK
jgi:hypothetical protein